MNIISKLFGKSPFEPLYKHMLKVKECVDLVKPLMESFIDGAQDDVEKYAKQIFKAEHKADLVKKEIRSRLPKSVFLPVSRGDLLRFLKEQDSIADSAEDLAALVTMRPMNVPEGLKVHLKGLVSKVLETYELAMKVSSEINLIVEASFGGAEAHKVLEMIEEIKVKEWEADIAQMKVAKKLFAMENEIDPVSIMMWTHVFKELGAIANHAENTGDNLGTMLHDS